MKRHELTHARLCELLHYDPDTGIFRWSQPGKNRAVGRIAGTLMINGYRTICIERVKYLEHRLAWFYMHREWPANEIDHINRSPADNRFANLRSVTSGQNKQNSKFYKNNKSGFRGIYWASDKNKWRAEIRANGRRHSLGHFESKEEAYGAYIKAAKNLHTHNPYVDGGA